MPDQLPFAKRRQDGTLDTWAVQPTGDYEADCSTGNNCFDQLMFRVAEKKSPLLIGFVMQAMIEKGVVSGVEVGFLASLGQHLITTA